LAYPSSFGFTKQRWEEPSRREIQTFPDIISFTNRPGKNNDMLDLFEALIREKGIGDPEGEIATAIQTWRKTREEQVRFTGHEVGQMESFLNRIAGSTRLSKIEKALRIGHAIDYKMRYEIQEAWDRSTKWRQSPGEIVGKIRGLDLSKYGSVIGEFGGESDYLVIVITQFHRGLGRNVEPEIIAAQREIAAIEDMLIDSGISNVLAVEGSDTKEIALELVEPPRAGNLVEYQDLLECSNDTNNPSINDLLAGSFGGSLWQEGFHRSVLHTFGVETPQVHDKAATFNLLARELVGVLRDLSFFGEGGDMPFGEAGEGQLESTFPKAGLIARLKTTLEASGAREDTLEQALQVLHQTWQSQEQLCFEDITAAAEEVQELMWRFSIDMRNLFFPLSLQQIRQNTLTNAIMFVVGVYHNQKELGEETPTLSDALLEYGISHIVVQPHTVQRILERTEHKPQLGNRRG
jgi:hypothetical protein